LLASNVVSKLCDISDVCLMQNQSTFLKRLFGNYYKQKIIILVFRSVNHHHVYP